MQAIWRGILFAALVGLAPVTASGFDPETGAGDGVVVEKDLVRGTVTIGHRVFRVSEGTRIYDAGGRRISFADLAVAPGRDGVRTLSPDATVRYEVRGSSVGSEPMLAVIRVLGEVIR